jgi:hypothetical protein
METIFIQIASYRDPELIPTVLDCIRKASDQRRIYFGICAQYDPLKDDLEELLFLHSNIRLKFVNYRDAKGTCWARSMAQSLYGNETYSLQIDSHMRFVDNWDEKLINMWKSLNDEKAVLTAYPGKYYPEEPESEWPIEPPTICGVDRVHEYKFKQKGRFITKEYTQPIPGYALSAAYIFGLGKMIKDVPYDPNLYFDGEEMSMALRLYTNGYNIYHPNEVFLLHYWTRKGALRHWGDDKNWAKYNDIANKRILALLGLEDIDLEIYGLGNIRTLDDYKIYSGIDILGRGIHSSVVDGIDLPIDYSEGKWLYEDEKETIKLKLTWDTKLIPNDKHITYWHVRIKDQHEATIHTFWISRHEHKNIITLKKKSIEVEFEYPSQISKITEFTIQPYSEVDKWLDIHTFST